MKSSRKKEILEIVNQTEIVSYQTLADKLQVSTMTIRRDINELANEDKVIKEHGGVRRLLAIKATNEKMALNVEEKEYMAKVASDLIQPNSVIYLGAGTSILYLAKQLKNDHKHIITNSLFTFNWLVENNFENVLLTGGEYVSKTGEFHGKHAENLVQDFLIDYAFLATNGIFENNMTTFSPFCARLQTIVMEHSKETYLLVDHSKFGVSDSYIFGKLNQLTAVISDDKLDESVKKHYEQYAKIIH
ncbi:DeoR/GlpR family DNA-binding transcription regulator [Streptococcus gallolyticus]|nr:DeoR/GlpR family DNA-binding transcription regulator [Streptococcus gallolyticus]MBY5040359.1 DeoR/GlpR family DNA-binding transcription regulator [Streptococcus gallolyticus]